MKPVFIVLIILLGAALVVGVFYILNQTPEKKVEVIPPITLSQITKPWIEVAKPAVYELKPDGAKIRELQTGDELNPGNIVETNNGAMANIHFPDGSVARLEEKTKLVLDEALFEHQTEKLTVRINLLIGRVWSKIIALATPDSLWEVKTANAVATVRGTAFGVGFSEGRSQIMGSQNEIKAAAVDPKTKELIKGTERAVLPDKLFEVETEDIPALKINPQLAVVKVVSKEMAKEDFFQRNKENDAVIDQKLEKLEKAGLPEKEVRQEFRKEIFEEFKEKIEERRMEIEKIESAAEQDKIQLTPETDLKIAPKEDSKPAAEPGSELAPTLQSPTETIKEAVKEPVSLAVVTKNTLSAIIEEDIIAFEAIVTMSDGSKVNVTASAKWQVLGQIGQIDRNGVFTAKLAPEIAEAGEASGAVVATWVDSATGEVFLGKSQIFKVGAKFEIPTIREG
jgi:hypothetical protein